MLGHELLELPDQLAMATEREVCLDALLEGRQPDLFETFDRRLCERFVCQVGESRSAPQRQSLAQELSRYRGVAALHRPAGIGDESLEAVQVELLGLEV
jgi:hypothetical protein